MSGVSLLFPVLAWVLVSPVPATAAPDRDEAIIALAAREWLSSSRAVPAAHFRAAPAIPDEWVRDDWDWVDRGVRDGGRATGEKSLLKAIAASALLPGLGERYAGSAGRASLFHATEAVIWSTFGFYRIQGVLRRDRYVEFAMVQGGASPDGDFDYYEHIGLWLSLDEWHEIVRRDARLRFPDDPAAQQEFFEENKKYDQGDAWEWASDDVRVRYRRLRSQSERSLRNSRLAIGVAIVNRLASMIDALALVRGHNKRVREEQARLELRIRPLGTTDGLVIGPVLSARY